MRRWKLAAAVLMTLLLLSLGLDIRYGIISGPRCRLPVLMYHHFAEDPLTGTIVSAGRFREQMTAVKEAGFTSVTLRQVLDYVENGTPLPDKPVLITMDDGYTSNLEVAAPILEQLGMCATVFVIGINEGETVYIHSGNPFYLARFAYEDAAPWVEKGVLDLQSHTFDMHQLAQDGFSGRDGMLQMDGESDADYFQALRGDMEQFRSRRDGKVPTSLIALAYPYGYWTDELDDFLSEEGIALTFTVMEHSNVLHTGDRNCLRRMGRFNVTESYNGERLVNRLERALKGTI